MPAAEADRTTLFTSASVRGKMFEGVLLRSDFSGSGGTETLEKPAKRVAATQHGFEPPALRFLLHESVRVR